MTRQPAVAGSFYTADAARLRDELDTYLDGGAHDRDYLGLVVPHAGYVYSGAIAGAAYKQARIPHKVLLFGPNHTGLGPRASVFAAGTWATPLGETPIAEPLAARLIDNCELLEADTSAHRFEHSLEVQIPFLQHLRTELEILPIVLGGGGLEDWLGLGRQIGAVLAMEEEKVLMIASSDMNHFKPADYTERVDRLAIARMEAFDPAGLYNVVRQQEITMCGVVPAVVMLEAARTLGAASCRLIAYAHSGRVNGDYDSVVGYAALGVS